MVSLRPVLRTVVALLLLAVGLAEAQADSTPSPQSFIQGLADTALQAVTDKSLNDAGRVDRFRRLFVSSFDLPGVSHFVLGRYWKIATPEQQQNFQTLFEEYEVLSWTQRFKDYKGEGLAVLGTNPDGDKAWIVDSQVNRDPLAPIPVQWKVRLADDGHLVVTDIIVTGVSMALTERQEYNAAMQANGGSVDGLLASIKGKVDQLRAAGGG